LSIFVTGTLRSIVSGSIVTNTGLIIFVDSEFATGNNIDTISFVV
jgi:hypothetical protein